MPSCNLIYSAQNTSRGLCTEYLTNYKILIIRLQVDKGKIDVSVQLFTAATAKIRAAQKERRAKKSRAKVAEMETED